MAVTLHVVSDDRDLARMLAIRNAIDARPLTLEGYHAERTAALGELVLLATLDGEDVGAGEVGWRAFMAEAGFAFVDAWVLPSARHQGVGRALIDRMIGFARDGGMTSLRSVVRDGDDESLGFAARRGFEVTARGQEGMLDLSAIDAPAPPVVPDVEVTTLADRPDLDRAAYDVMMRVRPEIPAMAGEVAPSFEAWRADTFGDPGFLPGLSVVALHDGRVVGIIEIYDNAEGVIFIGMTAVDPDYRRHGVARLLKAELSHRAKAAGMIRIETYNDGSNERIRALNESLGYVYLPWKLGLKGPIPPAAATGD